MSMLTVTIAGAGPIRRIVATIDGEVVTGDNQSVESKIDMVEFEPGSFNLEQTWWLMVDGKIAFETHDRPERTEAGDVVTYVWRDVFGDGATE